ncbi:ABC transporter permease [Roseburia sp. OF03-24]|jgi:putative ABC transport system permease protein|uniref:ABC transporter permease n=1 Tax=Roseburia sp. OF03-24 TaxID=2292367 RepID=UPI000E50906B|nr:ABC transporter permease [Roseburia sp. OF03-24]RGX91715.1 ABC transporter permease [Roseburia sp. OF03-24]
MNRLYLRLAWSNLKNSRQFYLPYVIAGMLSAMMFYTMCAIQGNDGLSKMRGGSSVQIVLYFGVVVVGVFVSIFLFYTNSFIMKRRKKELGVYNILGMEKIHVAKIMAWETVFSFLIAVGGGLITGIVFQKLLTMFLYRLTGLEAAIPFYISGWGCLHTAEMFGAIYVCILLYNLMQIRLSNPVELLHSGNTGEREPKTKIIQAVLGILCIVTGYYIAITTDNPVKAVSLFFVAVMLVIVGTYFLFNAGSIAFLKLLRENKRYYYQTRHFTTVSGMIYRMKQNAVGLANICILSTMVLVVISMTVCMYAGIEDELKTQYPAELELIFYDPDGQQDAQTFNRMADEIERVIKENGRVITGKQKGSYVGTAVAMTGNKITVLDRSAMDFSNMYVLEIMTKDGFEEYMQETIPDIPDGSVAVMMDSVYEQDTIVMGNTEYPVEQSMKFPIRDAVSEFVGGSVILIVKDENALENMRKQLAAMETEAYGEERTVDLTYVMNFDMSGSGEEKIACANAVRERVSEWQNDETNPKTMRLDCNVISRAEGHIDYETSNGGLLFLGLFLGSMFLMITVLIIYYKQISEGYEDKERFAIMEKVGMSNEEVKATIRSQVRMVFFLPLATAACHLAAAYPMLKKLLALVSLYNGTLFAWCLAGTVLVFGLIYLAVFIITSKSYYKIVGNQV